MRESTDSSKYSGTSRPNDYKLSTQDLGSPRNSFSNTMDKDSKKNRIKKNASLDGRGKDEKVRGRKTKSARQSATQTNEFFPKEIDKLPSGDFNENSKAKTEPLLLEREDYSFKVHNELTHEEIQGYEKYIKRSRLSGEDFIRFISTPLKKKSALELGLSEKKAQGYFLKKLSVEELMDEKNKVKNELKYYDKIFIKKVGKPPSNREKEPLK